MRTTLEIDDDVLTAAREIAAKRHTTMGNVISELVRRSLVSCTVLTERDGVPLFPTKGKKQIVTMELINALREGLE